MTERCYSCALRLVYPAVSLSILPIALSFCLFFNAVPDSASVLLIVFPVTDISISVGIFFCTFSFYFAHFEFSLVSGLIWPYHYSLSVHIILLEITLVYFSRIRKIIDSFAVKFSILKLSFIISSFEFKAALSSFLSVDKFSSVFYFLEIPGFCSVTMLLIILPVALIHASISVNKYSVAVGFTIFPVALIYVSINMSHSAASVILFIFSLPLILRAISKIDNTKSFPLFSFFRMPPVTFVLLLLTLCGRLQFIGRVRYFLEVVSPFQVLATLFRIEPPY